MREGRDRRDKRCSKRGPTASQPVGEAGIRVLVIEEGGEGGRGEGGGLMVTDGVRCPLLPLQKRLMSR